MKTAVKEMNALANGVLQKSRPGDENIKAPHERKTDWTDRLPEGFAGGYWFYPSNDDDL